MSRRKQNRQPGWILPALIAAALVITVVLVLSSRREPPAPPVEEGGSFQVHFIDEIGRAHV